MVSVQERPAAQDQGVECNAPLTAMLNQDVSNDLFARNVRFTENGIELPLGKEGLWWSMSGLAGYRFYVPDVETQQVTMIGTVKENISNGGVNNDQGNNVAVAIRLKIVEGSITEAEQLAIRPAVQLGRGGGALRHPLPVPGRSCARDEAASSDLVGDDS